MTEKYGFVYIWLDRKHKRYYVGCHWGDINDGYVCSSAWMKQAYRIRPQDFKRRILKTHIQHRPDMYAEEHRLLQMIKTSEMKPINDYPRYYNLNNSSAPLWHAYDENIKTIGQKISAKKKGKPSNLTPEQLAIRGKNISAAKKGKKFTDAHRQALSEAGRGRKHSEVWKQAQSERSKNMWSDPVWAEQQKTKLRAGAARRWNKSVS